MKSVDEIVEGFISYLDSIGQLNLLPEIVEKLRAKLNEVSQEALVISALPITSDEENDIRRLLKNRFGKEYKIRVKIEPSVLGGIRIEVGDQVIDQTIRGRLNTLKEELTK